jgi:glutamine synthetase
MGDAEQFDLSLRSQDDSTLAQLNAAKWKTILARHPEVEFVWLQFLLVEGSTRMRMIPVAYFFKMIEKNQNLSLSSAHLHLLRDDHVTLEAAPTGTMYLAPDISTAFVPSRESSRVRVLANLVNENHTPRPECLRTKLVNLSDILSHLHGFDILVGYEIEVIFFKNGDKDGKDPMASHKLCGMNLGMRAILPMVEAIVRTLNQEDILLEQYHAEMTPGQWEFVLPPQRPLEAVDTLMKTRDIIFTVADDCGYRATLHPRPFPDHGGSGAHLHLSVNSSTTSDPEHTDPFFAGIINHFPSLMAFCLPLDICYERVATGIWSGGEYISWGWENKETPLRRVANNRFELKLHCGMANPYTSLAAILAAGIDGLNKGLPLTAGDCQTSPAYMSEEQRTKLDIRPVPRFLQESIEHLIKDKGLQNILGEEYTATYISVTTEWNRQLNNMDSMSQRRMLLENY